MSASPIDNARSELAANRANHWSDQPRSRGVAHAGGLFDGSAAHIAAAALITGGLLAGALTIAAAGRATRRLHVTRRAPLLGSAATSCITALTDRPSCPRSPGD